MRSLYLLLITALCITWAKCGLIDRPKRSELDAETDIDRVVNENDIQNEAAPTGDLPYCFETEPCQFVFVKKNPRNNLLWKKTVPSWCQCNTSEECVQVVYDRKRKMEVYRCETPEQQQRRQMTANAGRRRRHHHRWYESDIEANAS